MAIPAPTLHIAAYKEACDWMIKYLGVNCRIEYAPIQNECNNCYFNTLPGVGASNTYRTGGPYPFTEGECPYCEGVGYKEVSTTEIIKVRAYPDKKSWVKVNGNFGVADGDLLIIGYYSDVPKFKNMSKLIFDTELEGFATLGYQLASEPIPWGLLKDRYFTAMLERT